MTAEVFAPIVYNADASAFAEWPHAHLSIFDPPYSEHVHENITSAGTTGAKSKGWHRQELEFPALTPEFRRYLSAQCARTAGWSLVFSDFEGGGAWVSDLNAAGAQIYKRAVPCIVEHAEQDDPAELVAGYTHTLPYVRWSQAQKSGDRPTQGFEIVLHAWAPNEVGKMRWFGPGNLTHYHARGMRGVDKHRTQKPLKLLLQMVSWYSLPGEVVRDLVMGSGTTLQAARILGRKSYGVERLPHWAQSALERVSSDLDDRDYRDVQRFCEEQTAEARAILATKPKADGSDKRTRGRAALRLADVERAAKWL